MFKSKQGIPHMFASHLTGWQPNEPILHRSTSLADGGLCSTFWQLLPRPTHGPLADTTYNSQARGACKWNAASPCFALAPAGCAPAGGSCRSPPAALAPPTPKQHMQSTFIYEHRFADGEQLLIWMGDRWNADGPGSVGNASYLWLPLLPHTDGGGYELVWAQNWRLRRYKGAQWDPQARAVQFAAHGDGGGGGSALPAVAVS